MKQCYGGDRMEHKNLHSINIEGLGTHSGGEFDRVTISGHGKITSDLKCQTLDVSGISTLQGDVEGESVRASGMGKFLKNIKASELDISGKVDVDGDIEVSTLYASGMFKAKQCLKTIQANITGMLSVEGDMVGEDITCDGSIQCKGFLNCESLEINIRCASKFNEVGATKVNISTQTNGFTGVIGRLFPINNKVIAQVIEGDEIDIESCEVKVLRGRDIKIGPKCKVGIVEYSGTLEVDPNAQIDQVNQV